MINNRSFASSRCVLHFAWIALPGWAGAFLTRTYRTLAYDHLSELGIQIYDPNSWSVALSPTPE